MSRINYVRSQKYSFVGVAASSTAYIELPANWCYRAIHLVPSGITAADMSQLRVVLNSGDTIHSYTGTQLDTIRQFDNARALATGGTLTIPFYRAGMKQKAQAIEAGLNCGVMAADGSIINKLRVEIDLGSGASGSIDAYTEFEAPYDGGPGSIFRMRSFTETPSGAAEQIYNKWAYGNKQYQFLSRLHFFVSTSSISQIVGLLDGQEVFRRTTAHNSEVQRQEGLRTPMSNHYAVDTTERGWGDENFPVAAVTDMTWKPTTAGAMSLSVIGEYFGSLA
jgi:hypothetical protein